MRKILAGATALSIGLVVLRILEDTNQIPHMPFLTHDLLPHVTLTYAATLHGYYWAKRFGASERVCWLSAVAMPLALGAGIEITQTYLMNMQNPDAVKDSLFNMAGFMPGAYTLWRHY